MLKKNGLLLVPFVEKGTTGVYSGNFQFGGEGVWWNQYKFRKFKKDKLQKQVYTPNFEAFKLKER